MGTEGKERVGKTEKVVCVKQTVSGNLLYNIQVALCDYLKRWERMGEGGSRERGYILIDNFH